MFCHTCIPSCSLLNILQLVWSENNMSLVVLSEFSKLDTCPFLNDIIAAPIKPIKIPTCDASMVSPTPNFFLILLVHNRGPCFFDFNLCLKGLYIWCWNKYWSQFGTATIAANEIQFTLLLSSFYLFFFFFWIRCDVMSFSLDKVKLSWVQSSKSRWICFIAVIID